MAAERLGQRHAAAHLLMDVVEHPAEDGVDDLMAQQIYRLHERHSGLEQRRKFLVEDEKFVMGDLAALWKQTAGERNSLSKRKHVQPLCFEVVAQARFALGGVRALHDFSRSGHQPAAKFHAKWLKL